MILSTSICGFSVFVDALLIGIPQRQRITLISSIKLFTHPFIQKFEFLFSISKKETSISLCVGCHSFNSTDKKNEIHEYIKIFFNHSFWCNFFYSFLICPTIIKVLSFI